MGFEMVNHPPLPGDEGSPQGRKIGQPCWNRFKITIEVTFLP